MAISFIYYSAFTATAIYPGRFAERQPPYQSRAAVSNWLSLLGNPVLQQSFAHQSSIPQRLRVCPPAALRRADVAGIVRDCLHLDRRCPHALCAATKMAATHRTAGSGFWHHRRSPSQHRPGWIGSGRIFYALSRSRTPFGIARHPCGSQRTWVSDSLGVLWIQCRSVWGARGRGSSHQLWLTPSATFERIRSAAASSICGLAADLLALAALTIFWQLGATFGVYALSHCSLWAGRKRGLGAAFRVRVHRRHLCRSV